MTPLRPRAALPTAAGLALGALADVVLGDPRRGHPVAGFGTVAAALERRVWRDSRVAGAGYAAALTGAAVAAGRGVDRLTRDRPLARTAATAVATWTVLGGTTLARTGRAMADRLEAGDLEGARARCRRCAGAIPRRWTRTDWPVPQSNPSPRTPPTPPLRRWCGARSAEFRACWATAR